MEVDRDQFLHAIVARCAKLPKLHVSIIGEPARAVALAQAIFEGDQRLLTLDVGRAPDAAADIVWSFDGNLGILVDEVPHAEIVDQTLDLLDAQAEQLQLASIQVASTTAKARVARAAVHALAGSMTGLDALPEFADQIARPMTIEALAQVAIAHGLRLDTAHYERRERLKDLAGAVALGVRDLPIPHDAAEAARALRLVGDALIHTCAAAISQAHLDVIAHFNTQVLATVAQN